jgi:predicted nucleic acid-binding protein
MQFGLFMMPLHPPHRAFADGYDRDVAQIVLADQLGFREAWVTQAPLRAADALHLALATSAQAGSLASFDARLRAAAQTVGLATYPA